MAEHREIVNQLIELLKKNPTWEKLLSSSIHKAHAKARAGLVEDNFIRYQFPPVNTLEHYYTYLDWMVRWSPAELEINYQGQTIHPAIQFNNEVYFQLCRFYWILDQPEGLELQKEQAFVDWMVNFANDWGSFLNTPESISEETLQSFIDDPQFGMDQYMMPPSAYTPVGTKTKSNGPSGWLTFNQFFAREVNPGLRPVDGLCDDRVITSASDSTFMEQFPITEQSTVTVKISHTYTIEKLLDNSPYKDAFKGGLFYHSFLGPEDYHRFHAPVSGKVLECRAVQEKVYLDVVITDDGEFDAPDSAGDGYEFCQTRGILILDSPRLGKVAVIPVGMAQVSSVNMPAVVGTHLSKGDEFGYFLFGGSDMILLFEAGKGVKMDTTPDQKHLVGRKIGTAK